ncbi:oxidoreductase, short chain dehydrogenase/reductase family protein [Aeromicrobium marinum DSM 15272]|uniref:Oxidoreductase, short chain dehydrogenase/reductase family protein n=1 Tax=Aeromicrobium marinum DSM 15272 TaxID=585531 RepID=E2S7Y7_9ACTN|nr:SDR family oxidoreductase [Aeromicrobium marinum]EFQ84803.1 oxidoreductase, short chain dehydrogenase/reductase family protein [Aeromicrobium marinum DSM 15272]
MTTTRPNALVTGASAGIGAAFAELLAAEGHDLIVVARRAERLEELAERLTAEHGITCTVLTADLTDPGAPEALMTTIGERGLTVDVLINNAGMSSSTAFADAPWSGLVGEIQLMVTAVTQLAHLVVPGMKERGHGRIVNLSSLAAFAPPGESLLYTGIKTYVLAMSQALDMELMPHGVHVTALCPGFTHSEFHDVMGTRDSASALPSILWQQPEAVVREGWDAVNKGKPVCVPGAVNKVISHAMRPVPFRAQYVLGRSLNPFKH